MTHDNRGTPANTRLILSALAERLIYGDEDTFSRQDALDLAELLPGLGWLARLAEWLPYVRVRGSLPGAAAAAFAAGVGNTSMSGAKTTFDRSRRVVQAGRWKLHRTGVGIEIEQVVASDADEGWYARVEFKRGKPVGLTLLAVVEVSRGPLMTANGRFRPWKRPV